MAKAFVEGMCRGVNQGLAQLSSALLGEPNTVDVFEIGWPATAERLADELEPPVEVKLAPGAHLFGVLEDAYEAALTAADSEARALFDRHGC